MKITQVSIQTQDILVAATSINAASLRGAANDDKAPMPSSSYRPTNNVQHDDVKTTPFYPRTRMNDGGEEPSSHDQPLESYAAFNRHGETAQAQGEYGSTPFFGTTHDPAEEEAYFAHLNTARNGNGLRIQCHPLAIR